MSEEPLGHLRRGSLDDLDRVASSLRVSPVRPPAVDGTGHRGVIRVCSPAPLPDIGSGGNGIVVDASTDVCRWVRHRRGSTRTVALCGSTCGLPLSSQAVDDVVIPAYTLQTLPDPSRILKEVHRVLKPGIGRLRTWWLLWPDRMTVRSTTRVIMVVGLRSTYRLAGDALSIERKDEAGHLARPVEQWQIRATRRAEVSAMLHAAGFGPHTWLAIARTDFDELTIGQVECNA